MIIKSHTAATCGLALLALGACDAAMDTGTDAAASRNASPAEGACLAAVADQVGTGGVSVMKTEISEANTVVYVNVPDAEAPWVCFTSPQGDVSEVRYSGSEGAL